MEGEDWVISSEEASDVDVDDDDDEQYYTSKNMPKLQFRKHISKSRWNDEMKMAEVFENKGGMWRTMGIVREGKIFCSIEETLFLAERGELSLSNANGSPIPLEDIYKKIAERKYGCSWESFEVYRHLRTLGYIVGRHGTRWSVKSTEDRSVSVGEGPEKKMISNQNFEEPNIIYKLFDDMSVSELKPAFDVYPPSSKFRKSSPGDPSFLLCVISGEPPSKQEIEDLDRRCNSIPLKLCHVEHGRVSFFSFNKVELPLLP